MAHTAGATVAAAHDAHDEEHPPAVVWSSRMPVGLMGMLFFIGSEIALFGSFFMAYFFIRVAGIAEYSDWATQVGDALPMDVVTMNSLILFASSVTIHYAEIALQRGARGWQSAWLALTLLLGGTFLTIQLLEYGELVTHEFIGPSTSAYSSVFFTLTGLHGTHVFVGAALLAIMLVRSLRGHYGPAADQHVGFRTMGVYWHFVDAVWLFVFLLIYVPGNWSRWGDATVLGVPGQVAFFGGAALLAALAVLPGLIGRGAPRDAH